MSDKFWVDGPPDKFEVGMWVEWRSNLIGTQRGIVIEPWSDSTSGAFVSCGVAQTYRLHRKDIGRHCPMMPVKEAEEMAREAWDARMDWPEDAGFVEWLDEWHERRAGDE